MNGGTRCKPRTKNMTGDKVTASDDENDEIPNFGVPITEKPSKYSEMTKMPVCTVGLDLYSQARKALSFRSPFDSVESPASESVILGANSLPGRVSGLLGRHSDSRKRHKRVHSGSEKKKKKSSVPGKSKGGSIWVEIEDYFRELSVEDVELIDKLGHFGYPNEDSEYFRIPSLDADDRLHERYEALNRKLAGGCGKIGLPLQNMVWLDCNGKVEVDEGVVEEEDRPRPMDVDIEELEAKELEVKEEKSNEARRENNGKETSSFGAVEWLLGSRNKTYLASERPSKKRKLLGRDAGLHKLLVAHPVEGLESVCHSCGFGGTTDPLNCLIKCASCGMVVHQWCYGVHDDVDSSWLCSWCKWKIAASSTCEASCFLCSKKGGALKPVQNERCETENGVTEVKFSHLFCCQWIPEVYVENTRTMEPVMNMDKLKDTRKKLLCYLCKVKRGVCVRCSSGSCRTSFHPICAREARHRMEIWGKRGCDEIELRAFCSKHSEVHCDGVRRDSGDISPTDDLDHRKPNDYDGENLRDNIRNFESHPEFGDVLHSSDRVEGHYDISTRNITILKKLIDLGRANAADVASYIGMSPESLKSVLIDNHVVPELQGKLMVWLKERALLKVKISSPSAPRNITDSEGVRVVPADESGAVPVKSVPPRRRTKSHLQFMKDGNSWSSKDKSSDCTADGDLVSCLHEKEDSDGPFKGFPASDDKKVEVDPGVRHYSTANNSAKTEAEMQSLFPCLSEDGIVGESRQPLLMGVRSPVQKNVEVSPTSSHIHPFIYAKLLQNSNGMLERTPVQDQDVACPRDNRGSHQLEASSSAGLCCKYGHNLLSTSGDLFSEHDGANLDQLVKARDLVMLKMSPENEVEGELIYYQQKLLSNALARKHISDNLILEVVKNLPLDFDFERQRKWDSVMVTRYNHELREARKQGRKERKHKEAQAILAAATAAAASSSRISSVRKDTLEEYPNQMMNHGAKDTIFGSAVTLSSSEFPKDHPRTCDVCSRSGTILNPILVCSSCKVAVHLDCYCSVKSTTGPWLCELCEELLSARASTNDSEKPYTVAECVLCGGTAGAFRKSVDGRWIHAFCAEWVLEPTYRRGQVANIEFVADSMGTDTCSICHRKQGVCLKCSYGHCQSMFHPTCARSAGFYMTKRTNGGKLQHKAYCEKHSVDQKAKVDTQKHGVVEFKSLKQVRVELERLRLLCERIAKREKLKREIVLCSHEILATSRDSLLLTLGRHPYYQQAISSESAATSNRGYTDDGEIDMQRSDGNITVDSTVAGKRRVKIPISTDNDKKTDDCSTLQNPYTLKPGERKSFSGKQIPQRVISLAQRNNLTDDVEMQSNSIIK